MTQHENVRSVRVVENYNLDTLGAPFRVTLVNGVAVGVDPVSGDEIVHLPDMAGLIAAVVRARANHPRKLSGVEIKFLRNALCVQAKSLAQYLDMSPEHLSRCEAGSKAMSSSSERLFRMFATTATFLADPEAALEKIIEGKVSGMKFKEEEGDKSSKLAEMLLARFLSMKIQAVYDPDDELKFDFVRRPREVQARRGDDEETRDGDWSGEFDLVAA